MDTVITNVIKVIIFSYSIKSLSAMKLIKITLEIIDTIIKNFTFLKEYSKLLNDCS